MRQNDMPFTQGAQSRILWYVICGVTQVSIVQRGAWMQHSKMNVVPCHNMPVWV